MSHKDSSQTDRKILKTTGRVAVVSALAGTTVPRVHAAENNTIQIALVGCGERGTGAVVDALNVKRGPVKLVAMADAFENSLNSSVRSLKDYGNKVDVPKDRQFVGLDAYKHAMDCLRPGDVVIFATPLAFRWIHFDYATKKGLNVFMEKPLTSDGPTSRRMFEIAKESVKKNLKVGVGLMSRHSRALQEVAKRIHDGEIGDIVLLRGYRMHNWADGLGPKPSHLSEMEFQIRKFHSFLWTSGGTFSDYYIHIIDHCCWMKDAWPIKVTGLGCRHYRGNNIDQNFDNYSVEYSFADGAKLVMDGRGMTAAEPIYHSVAQGTKGCAILSKSGDCGPPSSTYHGQVPKKENRIWKSKIAADQLCPYQNEWNDLIDAIRDNTPSHEAKRGIEASLVTSMGRMASHTGRSVTFDEMLNSNHEYAPNLDKLTMDGPAPLLPDSNGKYPIPMPGIIKKREF